MRDAAFFVPDTFWMVKLPDANGRCLTQKNYLAPAFTFVINNLCMRYIKWIGLAAALLLIFSCFLPWISVVSPHISVTGMDGGGSNFGKPGYFNLLMAFFFLVFHFIPRVWAKRANLAVVALNTAWAARNFFILSLCRAGDCPEKQTGLYLMLLASLGMLVAGLFPEMRLPEKQIKDKN
jgi:hypothetical protein